MFRHTARALLVLFVGLMWAPMMQPLVASAPAAHEACMRMEHACHHASGGGETAVRGSGRCEHDCCRGLTLRASAAMPLQVSIEARPAVVATVATRVQSSYRFQRGVSRPARAPPVISA
jgi:hypothetical protein